MNSITRKTDRGSFVQPSFPGEPKPGKKPTELAPAHHVAETANQNDGGAITEAAYDGFADLPVFGYTLISGNDNLRRDLSAEDGQGGLYRRSLLHLSF